MSLKTTQTLKKIAIQFARGVAIVTLPVLLLFVHKRKERMPKLLKWLGPAEGQNINGPFRFRVNNGIACEKPSFFKLYIARYKYLAFVHPVGYLAAKLGVSP